MGKVATILLLGMCAGCARHTPPPLTAVSPLPGLPPIPVDIDPTRPGLDVRVMPTAEAVAAGERTVRVSESVESSMLTRRPVTIPYPAEAAQKRLTGRVRFRAIIARDGSVQGLSVVETTNQIFVRAATASVQSWQYRPYLLNGQSVAVDTNITVTFSPVR
jgi:TonB family protein